MTTWDALRFCRDYGIVYSTEGKNVRPGHIHIQCPCCDDHSNHGSFDPQDGSYSCWRCPGSHPHVVISKLLHIDVSEAEKIYQEYEGTASVRKKRPRAEGNHPSSIKLPGGPLKPPHIKYIKRRGFDPDFLVEKYGILGTGPLEFWGPQDFSLRIIIPIYDINGRLVNFQGRDITNRQELKAKGPKVELAPLHHKHTLFEAHRAIESPHVGVVEGPWDQMRMGDGFVCSFGTSMTRQQIALLSRWQKITFLFDPEVEAQKRAEEYGKELSALGKEVEIVAADFGRGRDPGDLNYEEARDVRHELGFY